MQPRLWSRHMTFEEWRLQHLHLNDKNAFELYLHEQRLFENYQRDLINKQILTQNEVITEKVYNLANNISDIFTNSFELGGVALSRVLPGGQENTPNLELITDEGDLLITDEGHFLIT